jgi:small subunit ribosomal protein S5
MNKPEDNKQEKDIQPEENTQAQEKETLAQEDVTSQENGSSQDDQKAEDASSSETQEKVPVSEEKQEATLSKESSKSDAPNKDDKSKKSDAPKAESKPQPQKGASADQKKGQPEKETEILEKVISINRITKVTKGGKNLSFSALVVVGDTQGKVGYCLDKANEVATAIKKAIAGAKKNMIKVPLKGTTITHQIIGRCGGATVLLKPAVDGTGVIASGPVRAVCDGAGIHNILTKCHRSNNPINVVKATIDGLSRLKTKDD